MVEFDFHSAIPSACRAERLHHRIESGPHLSSHRDHCPEFMPNLLPRPTRHPFCFRDRVVRQAVFLALGIAWAIVLVAPLDARAVLIATGDGTGNTTAPVADPGFDNVGRIGVRSGVYVRNGWVLTAGHVGEKAIELLGVTYQPVPGSSVQFQNPDLSFADLIAWKILDAKPPLPDLTITDSAPTLGTEITVIGNGLKRGSQLSHMGTTGWDWAVGWETRWGTNEISNLDADGTYSIATQSFAARFDEVLFPGPDEHEAALAHGDSGGAAFTGSGASSELVGILFASVATLINQPAYSSFYTNDGLAVDLFPYRSDILAAIDQPSCNDGLDDDGDGFTDFPNDPGCTDALDSDERGPTYECDNGLDDDGDGDSDFPNDVDCTSPTGTEAAPPLVPTSLLGAGILTVALYAQIQRTLRRESVDID